MYPLLILLLASHGLIALSQGRAAPRCQNVRSFFRNGFPGRKNGVEFSGAVVLDSNILADLKNHDGVQEFLDCLPPYATVRVTAPKWRLDSTVRITRPVEIEGQSTSIECHGNITDPAIDITSEDVFLRGFSFAGCNLSSPDGLMLIKNSQNVTLRNMVFEGNENTVGSGCISVINSTFIQMQNITAKNNKGKDGGAISITKSSGVEIIESQFKNNNATEHGGAIYMQDSKLNISYSRFTGNAAVHQDGGSIFAQGEMSSEVKIEGGDFIGNQVLGESGDDSNWRGGGAIKFIGPELKAKIFGSTFVNNWAKYDGGAVSIYNGVDASIHVSDFIENSSFQGGAIYVQSSSPNMTTVDLDTCTFEKNNLKGSFKGSLQLGGGSTQLGGAIAMFNDGIVANIKSTNFTENKSGDNGGALFIDRIIELNITGSTFLGNAAGPFNVTTEDQLMSRMGGAVFLESIPEIFIEKSNFTGNRADTAGGIFVASLELDESNLRINESIFEGNVAMISGGAIELRESTRGTITAVNFTGNSAVGDPDGLEGSGGALTLSFGVEASLRDVRFTNNTANDDGGAIFLLNSFLEVEEALFEANSVKEQGGAIFVGGRTGNVTLSSILFESNEAVLGGGFFVEGGADVNVSSSDFHSNTAAKGGGAIAAQHWDFNNRVYDQNENSDIRVESCRFSENQASALDFGSKDSISWEERGGAAMLMGMGVVANFTECTFSKNEAGTGGSIYSEDIRRIKIFSSEFSRSSAETRGGALTTINTLYGLEAENVTFWNNTAKEGGAVSIAQTDNYLFPWIFGSLTTEDAYAVFKNASFVGNNASEGGGAIDMMGVIVDCYTCHFESNHAGDGEGSDLGDGGGIRVQNSADLNLTHSSVDQCTAARHGGGIYIKDAMFTGEKVTVINNNASENGGGFAAHYTPSFNNDEFVFWSCVSCAINENDGKVGGGMHIAIAMDSDSGQDSDAHRFLVSHTSLANNTATESDGGMFLNTLPLLKVCCPEGCFTGDQLADSPQKCPDVDLVGEMKVGTSMKTVSINPPEVSGHSSSSD